MRVQLEVQPDGKHARFSLTAGSEGFFHCIMSGYGVPGTFTRPSGVRGITHRHYFVPLSAAMLAAISVTRVGGQLFASDAVQAHVRGKAWSPVTLSSASGKTLFPYQKAGAEFLHSRKRALLCDQMGLGKTISSLAALDKTKATLVVVPSIVLGNWYNESREWRPDLPVTIWKRPYGLFPAPGEIRIASYSSLPFEHIEERTRCPFCQAVSVMKVEPIPGTASLFTHMCDRERGGLCGRRFNQREDAWTEFAWTGDGPKHSTQLVVDEAHYCKTKDSKRTLAVRGIASQCSSTWLLTGTPLLNTPEELWSLCQIFPGFDSLDAFDTGAHSVFGSWKTFVEYFGGKKKYFGGYSWPASGEVDPEARLRLSTIMLRRMRVDVLPDLPVKTRRFIDVDVLGPHLKLDAEMRARLEAWSDAEVLKECEPDGSLSTVRKDLATAKSSAIGPLLEEYETANEPVVVFSYHRDPIIELGRRRGWACITGSTSDRERTALVKSFQAGKLKGLAGTIGAMGVGVTLTASANSIFIDRDYVPANNLQAEDREVRIGQTRGVVVTILNAKHMVDQRVNAILARKEALLEGMELSEEVSA